MTGDDFERDELDRALSAGLADLAPAEPDAASALASMRPGMQRARTRHRVLQTSAVAAVVLVLGIGAALASPSSKGAHVQVSNPPTTENNSDRSRGTSTTTPNETTAPGTTPSTIAAPNATSKGATPNVTMPAGGPPPTNPQTGGGTPTTGPAPNAATTIAPDPGSDHPYASRGGTLTVHFANGKLSIVDYAPAAGYTATVHTNKPDDVEVRFRKGNDQPRIRVRVDHGTLVPEIDD